MKQKNNITSLPKIDSSKEKDDRSIVSSLSPREIVSELDRYVIGQNAAKRAVAEGVIALDKAAQKGVIHPNNAARRKSRLEKMLKRSAE